MIKSIVFKTKGMQRDLSASAFNSEYAYENKNVRVMPTDESTLLSLINEKGNKKSSIAGVGDYIKGTPIGQALVNNELIIFAAGDDDYRLADITPNIFEAPDIFLCDVLITDLTAGEDTVNDITPDISSIGDITLVDCPYKLNIDVDSMLDDRIYKLWFNNGVLTGKRLFRGNLGFNYKHPIETISFYENTDIRKVYWTDGLNQPRVINIAAASDVVSKWNTDSFNFVRTINLNEEITIERNIVANGNFAPGVIQYAFTYFDKYGQESNIFYTSPLYYISYNNRGASPEDKVANSFTIKISKADPNFDYLRVYSILRTSKDATPIVKRVVDLKIGESTQSNSPAPMAVAATNDGTYTGNLDKFGNIMAITHIGEPIRQIDYNNDGFYVQGAVAYGRYLFQAYIAGKYIDVVDLTTNTRIATLTTNISFDFIKYHGNVLSFGPEIPAGSNFPYLYYSCENNDIPRILVFKINSPLSTSPTDTWNGELVQTIYLPKCDGGDSQGESVGSNDSFTHYFQNGCVDAENKCIWVSGYTVNSYKDSTNNNQLVYRKYNLPNAGGSAVYLSHQDVQSSFTLPFKKGTQGMVIKNNILYQCFGYDANDLYDEFLDGIDLSKKSIIHSYKFPKEQLKDLGEELESPYIYLNNLYLSATCHNWRYYTLWQVKFKDDGTSGGGSGGGVIVVPPESPDPDDSPSNYDIYYIDDGLHGDIIDPTELLYVGGEEVVFGTMAQKDNTLFLGDIEIKRKTLDSTIRSYFKGKSITFSAYNKNISSPEARGYYPYSNQLKMNSYQFKTFKYLEYYRFGIQAQHYTGKWSEPIWINDVRNTVHIDTTFFSSNNIGLPVAEFTLNDSTIINRLLANGYVRVRPVVVYPTINDREAVCQGILCPTVYNVSDRFGNSPFAQSSWFTRPNAPFDKYRAFHYNQNNEGAWGGDWAGLGQFLGNPSAYSRAGIMSNNRTIVTSEGTQYNIDIVNKGAWAEFRHNRPIPGNNNRNAEIQCIWNPPSVPYVDDNATDSDVASWVSNNAENYYIDQSILTFHSPDIEFDNEIRSIDTSGLKLRIVGMVPITAFASDIDIQTSTPVNNFHDSSELPAGFYKEPIGIENDFSYESIGVHLGDSHFGWRGLISGAFWFDEITAYKKDTGNTKHLTTGFVVYPWHRNGSLNNTKYATDGYRSAMLDKKKMSNMRYSYKSVYLDSDKIWNAYASGSSINTGISGVAIFDSNEVSLIRLPAQKNSGLTDINYYGNVDKLLTISRIGDKKDGYPIMTTGTQSAETNAHTLFSSSYIQVDSRFTDQITGTDPVRIKYKSTPHAVLALNYTTSGAQRILPNITDGDYNNTWTVNLQSLGAIGDKHMFWDKSKRVKSVSQDTITYAPRGPISGVLSIQHGWLWLGELYNDNVQNRFGGQTEEAFENNTWLPCGDPISLVDTNNGVKSSITIRWEEGDTYFQRYDHIKTYPFTLEDQNAVTDIVSFMCETRVNIDGRYDRNRGQTSNFSITPENFNLMNDVYSQSNNFFNYRTINPNKLNLDNFHNSITWTKTKTAGELVDTWTNITLASTLDLDGDKGTVRALRRFNNNIFAFQDRGISQILYNENMQISSTDGVPIEIANSGKVNGKRYISDRIGCTNKWSMCETSNGIYFIDDITKGIFLFNGQLNNISDRLGFHSWINRASKNVSIWNPVDFDGFVTYYDKVNGDVFFISKDECLAFSEPLGQFSSFYSYEKTPYFTNLEDRGIAFNVEGTGTLYKPWLHNEGDYNMFFGVYQPFYTTVIANPDMPVDKIFNNLEFRSDSWDKEGNLLNTTFDTLNVWNEYQEGTSTLSNTLDRPSSLKKKFRIWRANIPRAKANGRDRMRNPWLYIKLSMEEENVNKTVLHDMIVHYFE